MLGDYQLHHTVLRRYYKHKEILKEPYFIEIRDCFKQYCIDKDYSTVTIDHYVKQSSRFMDYLVSQNVNNCRDINLKLINAYIKTLAGYAYKTIEQVICSLRAFFRFLLEAGKVKTDFASKTPMVQARKQTRIKDELKKLIVAIDKGSPMGKRDYAIILLAGCLGLRCTDIKNLKMKHFYWEEKKLVFRQSKTKEISTLPLTNELGWAVINYLKYGRPKIESPYVFDVSLKDGILTIEKSKKDNSRLVAMPDSLTKRCKVYSKAVHYFSANDDYFFPAVDGNPLTKGNLYKNFRKFLWQAGISHGGRGHGPRIYDFRHSYAVHCLRKWVK